MIARHEGQVVLVLGGIPGERVRARVERVDKRLAFASAADILTASADRRAVFADPLCGGCVYAHIEYPRQTALKSEVIADAFVRIGRIPLESPVAVATSRESGYRLRARLHVAGGRPGFFREGTHQLCDAGATGQLLPESVTAIEAALSALGAGARGRGVDRDQRERRGRRARVAPRVGRAGAWGGDSLDRGRRGTVDRLHRALRERRLRDGGEPGRVGSARRADRRPRLGRRASTACRVVLPGQPLPDCRSRQRRAWTPCRPRGTSSISTRGSACSLSRLPPRDATASRRWKGTARAAPISCGTPCRTRASFRPSSAAWRSTCAAARPWGRSSWIRRVPACPGRRWTPSSSSQASRLVYVSCDPPTMARDARRLLDAGYRLASMQGFDLFPNTPHVEAVGVFDRS